MSAVVVMHTSGESCQRVVRRLLKEGATSPWSAKPFEPRRRLEERSLERGLRMGLVVRTEDGLYWVNQEKYEAWCTTQRRILIVAATVMALLLGILYILGELS
jgi:hypothetical protein